MTATDGAKGGREFFDIPAEVSYFNAASIAPTLTASLEAGRAALAWRARPWEIRVEDWFTGAERRRELFASLIGADSGEIALVPASSYGCATAAANLTVRRGQEVVVLDGEYPSGVYTWRRCAAERGAELRTVSRGPGQGWTEAVLEAIGERTAVVSVPQVHWTDGAFLDLVAVSRATRAAGAALVIDASQSAGAMPLDVREIRPDFLFAVGYKWLLGPFGLGYLYADPAHHGGRPLEENWILRKDAQDFSRLVDYRDAYEDGARRFDVGQRTEFELTPMAIAALERMNAWTPAGVARALARHTVRIADAARAAGWSVPEPHGPHMFGIHLPPGVRPGLMAALEERQVHTAARGDALLAEITGRSPHLAPMATNCAAPDTGNMELL
ncbi:aminotransferase class V-fold PLP-dependent enzyme, partial [Streptomyces sp. NPDC059564]|uniref:aminotransferase class V-fold PLP-dependent enzyme n=1 Tax=Streptomyces sp. NPDC059564 TaxID=3346865 RepID=UPI0036911E7C